MGTGQHSARYADMMIGAFGPVGNIRSTTKALVLAEVFSSSTMHIDFGNKLDEYTRLPDLGTYSICAQDKAQVWAWTRADGRWPDTPQILEELDATLDLPILAITLPLAEIYRHIVAA